MLSLPFHSHTKCKGTTDCQSKRESVKLCVEQIKENQRRSQADREYSTGPGQRRDRSLMIQHS